MYGQDVARVTTIKSGRRNKATGVYIDGVDGLDELINAFNNLGEDAIYKLAEPSVKAANVVLKKAKAKIHNVDNDLSDALKVVGPGRKRGHAYQIFARVTFGKKGAHGVPLELGHNIVRHGDTFGAVSERPFLRPAADESREEVANILTDAMNEILDEVWGGK